MDFCRTVETLYAALPLRPFRDWLIRVHMERCPRCQERLLSREEARVLLVGREQAGDVDALWRRIAGEANSVGTTNSGGAAALVDSAGPAGLVVADAADGRIEPAATPRGRGGRLAWQWAPAAALTLVVALAGLWLLRESGTVPGFDARAAAPPDRLEIAYVRVGGQPAQTFIYQAQGTDTVFVWAQKTP